MRIRGLSVLIAVAALGLGAVCSAQTESKTVTYSTVAKAADKVIADIAAQTGEQLEVTKDAQRHVLVLHVVDVPLDELLDRIATVTSSRWTKESGGRRTLRPDQPLRRRLEREAQQERAAAIRQSITKIQEQLQEAGEREYGTGANTMFGRFGPMSTPGSIALAKLTVLLRPADIAGIENGQRIVYSTSPNRMQRSLGGNAVTSILDNLVAEHNAWHRSTAQQREEKRIEIEKKLVLTGEAAAIFMMTLSAQEPKIIDSSVDEALLVVERGAPGQLGWNGGISVSLSLLDATGNVLLSEEMGLGSSSFDYDESAATSGGELEGEGDEEVDETDTAPVQFRDISVQVARVIQRFSFEDDTPEIAPDVLQVIMSPVQNEPLSFAESDGLLAVAKAKGWNLVANVPDDFDLSRLALAEGETTVGAVLDVIGGDSNIEAMLDGDWYSLVPANPVLSLTERVDRAAVQAYVSGVRARGYASLDDMAFLASRMSEDASRTHAAQAIRLSGHPMDLTSVGREGLWETLRFWDLLSSGVKQSLLRGESLNFNQLGTAARDQVSKMVYGSGANLIPRAQLAEERGMTMWDRLATRRMSGQSIASYLNEPTEVMPEGLPAMGSISINVTSGGLAVMAKRGSSNMGFFQAVGAEEIATTQFLQDLADKAGRDMGISNLGSFKIGTRNKLEIVFHLSQEAVMARSLNDDSIEPGARVVRLTNLPVEFAAEVNAIKAVLAKSPFVAMLMMGFGSAQGAKPPEFDGH